MAGSLGHVHDPEQPGGFRFDLIENMGDAHEACEDMHGIILLLAAGDERKLRAAESAWYAIARGEAEMPAGFTNITLHE